MIKPLLTCVSAAMLWASPALARPDGDGFEVGQYLPDLELPTIDGTGVVRLSELRGQRLLLIHFASW